MVLTFFSGSLLILRLLFMLLPRLSTHGRSRHNGYSPTDLTFELQEVVSKLRPVDGNSFPHISNIHRLDIFRWPFLLLAFLTLHHNFARCTFLFPPDFNAGLTYKPHTVSCQFTNRTLSLVNLQTAHTLLTTILNTSRATRNTFLLLPLDPCTLLSSSVPSTTFPSSHLTALNHAFIYLSGKTTHLARPSSSGITWLPLLIHLSVHLSDLLCCWTPSCFCCSFQRQQPSGLLPRQYPVLTVNRLTKSERVR